MQLTDLVLPCAKAASLNLVISTGYWEALNSTVREAGGARLSLELCQDFKALVVALW